MEFHLIPNYKKPQKISKFSQGFQHTLQSLPTWRKSELPSGNQNNIRNFNKLYEFWGDPPLKEIDHDFLHATLQEVHEATGNGNSTLNRSISTVTKVLSLCARSGYIPYVPKIEKLKEELASAQNNPKVSEEAMKQAAVAEEKVRREQNL